MCIQQKTKKINKYNNNKFHIWGIFPHLLDTKIKIFTERKVSEKAENCRINKSIVIGKQTKKVSQYDPYSRAYIYICILAVWPWRCPCLIQNEGEI